MPKPKEKIPTKSKSTMSSMGKVLVGKNKGQYYIPLTPEMIKHLKINKSGSASLYWVLSTGTVQLSNSAPRLTIPICTEQNHQFLDKI